MCPGACGCGWPGPAQGERVRRLRGGCEPSHGQETEKQERGQVGEVLGLGGGLATRPRGSGGRSGEVVGCRRPLLLPQPAYAESGYFLFTPPLFPEEEFETVTSSARVFWNPARDNLSCRRFSFSCGLAPFSSPMCSFGPPRRGCLRFWVLSRWPLWTGCRRAALRRLLLLRLGCRRQPRAVSSWLVR